MRVHARRAQNRAAKVRRELPPGAINNEGVSAVIKRDDASPAHFPNFSPIESATRESSPLADRCIARISNMENTRRVVN